MYAELTQNKKCKNLRIKSLRDNNTERRFTFLVSRSTNWLCKESSIYSFNTRIDWFNWGYFSNYGVSRLCKPRDYKWVGTLSYGAFKWSKTGK